MSASLQAGRRLHRHAAAAAIRSRWCSMRDGLDDERMQAFARWTNLCETTFLLPPDRAAAPTTACASSRPAASCRSPAIRRWAAAMRGCEAGGRPQGGRRASCSSARVGPGAHPARGRAAGFRRAAAARAARRARRLAAGGARRSACSARTDRRRAVAGQRAGLAGLLLDDAATVLALDARPARADCKQLSRRQGRRRRRSYRDAPRQRARASRCAPSRQPIGIPEDPVTGSLNASLAQWLIAEGHMPARYVAAQGACLERAGRVHIERDAAGQVWVGGESVTCIRRSVHCEHRSAALDHLVVAADTPGPWRAMVRGHAGRHARARRRACADGHAQPAAARRDTRDTREPIWRSSPIDSAAHAPASATALVRPGRRRRCSAKSHAAARGWCTSSPHGRRCGGAEGAAPAWASSAARWWRRTRETPPGCCDWQISVRPDGQRLFYGGLPTLIQWGAVHPADAMPEAGLALQSLHVGHPRAA